MCFYKMLIKKIIFFRYYIDKVMEYALLSPYFTEKFTMSYKLITLMKTHGESVKRKMFTKLQTVFKDMQLLMSGKNFTSDFLQCFL